MIPIMGLFVLLFVGTGRRKGTNNVMIRTLIATMAALIPAKSNKAGTAPHPVLLSAETGSSEALKAVTTRALKMETDAHHLAKLKVDGHARVSLHPVEGFVGTGS